MVEPGLAPGRLADDEPRAPVLSGVWGLFPEYQMSEVAMAGRIRATV